MDLQALVRQRSNEVTPQDERSICMPGYQKWAPKNGGDRVETFTILTTVPNEFMATVHHHRMPVMLAQNDWRHGQARPAPHPIRSRISAGHFHRSA
jgi:putative SOS response-associated peptidase YedK